MMKTKMKAKLITGVLLMACTTLAQAQGGQSDASSPFKNDRQKINGIPAVSSPSAPVDTAQAPAQPAPQQPEAVTLQQPITSQPVAQQPAPPQPVPAALAQTPPPAPQQPEAVTLQQPITSQPAPQPAPTTLAQAPQPAAPQAAPQQAVPQPAPVALAQAASQPAPQRAAAPQARPASLVQAAPAQPAVPIRPSLALRLHENTLLSRDIEHWATGQGLRLLWNSNKDYLIYSPITVHGKERDEVLYELGKLFQSENYGLVIKLYEANNVLIIDSQ